MAEEQAIEQAGGEELSADGGAEQITPEQALEARFSEILENQRYLMAQVNNAVGEARGAQGLANRADHAINAIKAELADQFAPKTAMRLLEQIVRRTDGDDAWAQYERDQKYDQALAKATETKPETETQRIGPTSAEQQAQLIIAEFGPVKTSIRREYTRLGVPVAIFEDAWQSNKIQRRDYSTEDPHGWEGFREDALKLARDWKAQAVAGAKPRTAIDPTKGSGGATISYEEAQKRQWDTSQKGLAASITEYEKILAAAQK